MVVVVVVIIGSKRHSLLLLLSVMQTHHCLVHWLRSIGALKCFFLMVIH